jgi:hypothetical protein
VAVLVTASVLGASCSTSGSATRPKHRSPPAPTTTASTTTTVVFQTLPPRVALGPAGQVRVNTGPVIGRFKPTSSPVGGTVTIVGRRVGSTKEVLIAGIPATISFKDATRVKVVVPPGATSGTITVVTPYGSDTKAGFVVT